MQKPEFDQDNPDQDNTRIKQRNLRIVIFVMTKFEKQLNRSFLYELKTKGSVNLSERSKLIRIAIVRLIRMNQLLLKSTKYERNREQQIISSAEKEGRVYRYNGRFYG